MRNLRLLICVGFAMSAGQTALSQSAGQVSGDQRPNILLIYTDDQGYGDLSCLNPDSKFDTPNIDRLASEGIVFTDGHCSDTVCTPSRYGLLTGRYSWRTHLKTGVMRAEGECLIPEGRMTLASLLREQGYITAMVGKWHLGMDFPGTSYRNRDWSQPVKDMPLDKGFDYFFGVPASLNYGVLAWFEGRFAAVPPTLFTAKKPNQRHVDYRIAPPYQTNPAETKRLLGAAGMEVAPDFVDNQCLTKFTDKAIEWMRRESSSPQSAQPFFLYLPLTSPHYPVCPLPQFHGRGGAGGYGEFMIETDFHVGRLLDFLSESKLADNTLVIFTSDNGPENSWKRRVEEFKHRSNGVYREGKRSIYEGGHRVPFLIRWPAGTVTPGRTSAVTICQTDLLATIADIVGVRLPAGAGEDSQSFYRILQEPNTQLDRRPIIHHAANGRFSIRSGRWKLVMQHESDLQELYDVIADPGERVDLLSTYPQIAAGLQQEITSIVVNGRTTAGEPQPNDSGYWGDLAWMSEQEYVAKSP